MAAKRIIDHYGVLGVEPDASAEQIKKVWRRIARATHPDIHGEDESLTERFKQAQEAYAILGDPEKRNRYDLLRHVESSKRACLTCGRPVYGGHDLCRFCRVAAEKERKKREWQRRQAKLRREAEKVAKAMAEARAEQRWEEEFGVFGNDVGMGISSSDELFQSLLAESALRRAQKGHRPSMTIGGDGVTIDLRPGVKIRVNRNTIDTMRSVHRNLTTAEKIIRQVRRWF